MLKSKLLTISILMLFSCPLIFGQTAQHTVLSNAGASSKIVLGDAKAVKRFGVQAGLILNLGEGEYGAYKFQANHLIKPNVGIEINALLDPEGGGGFDGGVKYFLVPFGTKKLHPYVGMNLGWLDEYIILKLPFGLSYTMRKGFEARLGLEPYSNPSNLGSGVFGEFTLGWRF